MNRRHAIEGRKSRFQSAPLTEVRGDRFIQKGNPTSVTFQSAPLTEVRGDCLKSE